MSAGLLLVRGDSATFRGLVEAYAGDAGERRMEPAWVTVTPIAKPANGRGMRLRTRGRRYPVIFLSRDAVRVMQNLLILNGYDAPYSMIPVVEWEA